MPNEKVNWECLKELIAEYCKFPDSAIADILSGCPLLESLTLLSCVFDDLVFISRSLKNLVLVANDEYEDSVLEILCPMLEELELSDFIARVVNSPLLSSATIDSEVLSDMEEILPQLQHVKELKFKRRLTGVSNHSIF